MASIILIGNKATENQSLGDAIRSAPTDSIILADTSFSLTEAQIANLSEAAIDLEENGYVYIAGNGDISKEELSMLDAGTLLNLLINRSSLPVAALAASKASIIELLDESVQTLSEIAYRLSAKAISAGASIIAADSSDSDSRGSELSNAGASRVLGQMVNAFTIEDLFPQNAWKDHSGESAAAAYHTLTAFFMRFEDYASAAECLKLSDQFEESPRSLALRALIAFNKGETLGAVANLVSSLQQYEERKKSTTHYIKFSPQDIELINSSLVSGLDALNKRDNESAIDHFAKAVFNFDAFYAQHGLEDIIQ